MARTAFLETEDLRDLWDHRENRERMGLAALREDRGHKAKPADLVYRDRRENVEMTRESPQTS